MPEIAHNKIRSTILFLIIAISLLRVTTVINTWWTAVLVGNMTVLFLLYDLARSYKRKAFVTNMAGRRMRITGKWARIFSVVGIVYFLTILAAILLFAFAPKFFSTIIHSKMGNMLVSINIAITLLLNGILAAKGR